MRYRVQGSEVFSDIFNITDLSYTIVNLQKFVFYTVTVRAATSVGLGDFSSAADVATLEDVPEAAPLSLQAQALSSVAVQV